MAFETRQYDPAQVIVNVGGRDISGFADGTFVRCARNADAFTLAVGADGESTRAKSNNRSGRITITLQQSSPSNDYLNSLAEADEKTNSGAVPAMVKDALGTTKANAKKAWVVKRPDGENAKEVQNREWVLETGNLEYDVGGNNAL